MGKEINPQIMKHFIKNWIGIVTMLLPISVAFAQQGNTGTNNKSETAVNNINKEINASIFPNPCSNEINVYYENIGLNQVTIKISDIVGNLINTRDYKNLDMGLLTFYYDISLLPAGEYFVTVEDANGSKNLKLVKQ